MVDFKRFAVCHADSSSSSPALRACVKLKNLDRGRAILRSLPLAERANNALLWRPSICLQSVPSWSVQRRCGWAALRVRSIAGGGVLGGGVWLLGAARG